jgi:hypothetical protein
MQMSDDSKLRKENALAMLRMAYTLMDAVPSLKESTKKVKEVLDAEGCKEATTTLPSFLQETIPHRGVPRLLSLSKK